jgi:glycerol-3-phosphate acyltransferase PlsX
MRVVLDAMGGDHGPRETVPGAIAAARRFGIAVTVVGREEEIRPFVPEPWPDGFRIVDAREVIGGDEAPTEAVRQKPDASMVRGLQEVAEGRGDVFVSAGNTGALVAGSLLTFGMLDGMRRPALAALLPTYIRKPLLLVDAGGSVDPKPEQFVDNAVLGSLYAERVLGYREPQVALLNIGTEPGKGNRLARAAYELLRQAPVRFVGNVEARELMSGHVQVVLTDGFVGNVTLKLAEGFALTLFRLLKEEMTATLPNRLASLVLAPRIHRLADSLDWTNYGGAPLFGPRAPVIKCHGSSRAKAIMNGIRVARDFAASGVLTAMVERMRGVGGEAGV